MKKELDSRWGLLIALLFALLFALWLQVPRLADPYMVEEDFRNFFWMNRYLDPDLYDETLLFQLYPRLAVIEIGTLSIPIDSGSPGYSVLFWAASALVPPVLFSKLLVFPLLGLSVFYIYRLGEKLRGVGTALVLALAFVVMNMSASSTSSTLGGLQRSFITVLLLAEMYYLMNKRDIAAALVIFLASLIYPPAFLLCVTMYGLSLWQAPAPGRWIPDLAWRRLVPLIIVGVASVLVLVPLLLRQGGQTSPFAAATTEKISVFADPLYQEGGRRQFFDVFPVLGRGGISTEGPEFLYIILFFGLAVVAWMLDRNTIRLLHPVLKQLFFASIICYSVAWLFFILTTSLILYLPSRYTMTSFSLFGLIFVMINGEEGMRQLAAAILRQRHTLNRLAGFLALFGLALVIFLPSGGIGVGRGNTRWLLLGLVLLLLLLTWLVHRRGPHVSPAIEQTPPALSPTGWFILSLPIFLLWLAYALFATLGFYEATPTERALFAFLQTVPKDAIIAGAPCDTQSLPMFAQRLTLFNCEQSHPSVQVMRDGLWAYYAADWQTITQFCTQYGVDYLVVNQQSFTPEALADGPYFFEPYDSELRPILQEQKTFALANVAESEKLFQQDDFYVVACR